MNISFQNIDNVSGMLTMKVEKADYQDLVEKQLKTFKHKAQMPGFRPGMVPMGLVRKMYYKSAMAEEINKLISQEVYKYIKDNNIEILGEPLPNEEKQGEIDFDTMEDFEFVFDLALAPQFEVELSKKDKLTYYKVAVTDEMVDKQVSSYRSRMGTHEQADSFADNDMLKGLLTELNEDGQAKEGGLTRDAVVMMPEYMKDADQKALFKGAAKESVVIFNPTKAFESASEVASLLSIPKEEAEQVTSDFSYKIEEITRFVEAPLDQELFDKIFEKDTVKTEEEFRNKVKETIEAQFAPSADFKLLLDVRKLLMDKIKPEYSEPLMKRIMKANNEDRDAAFVDEHYTKSIEELTWHLIKEKLVKVNNVKVEPDEVLAEAKNETRSRFAQYGMMNVPEELLENYAKEMMKKEEDVNHLVSRVIDNKLTVALKPQVTLKTKTVTPEEFNKLFE
ncbi:MAG: trigger factor [Prevotellaceae bacterium]|jgi:trigger factor|nr:trigger factor [Prevotellaceae bacterium]